MHRIASPASSGFTMIEALVALLVISAGVLGVSIAFAESVAHGRSALYRTEAVYLTENLAESIRANAAAGTAYDPLQYPDGPTRQTCAAGGSTTAGCTPGELAEADLADWEGTASAVFPAPRQDSVEAAVPTGLDATRHFRVQLLWHEPGLDEPLNATADLIIANSGEAP
jgi:type IV pilus assembly protein PilV